MKRDDHSRAPRPRNAFRPSLIFLEQRRLLSAVPALKNTLSQVAATVQPVVGNESLSAATWLTLHQEFVNRAAQEDTNVIFLGDSITYFWTSAGATPLTSAVRQQLEQPWGTSAWQSFIAPLGAANFGIPGDTTKDLLWRIENGEVQGTPKVAVILVGLNDLRNGESPAETAAGTVADVEALRARSPKTKIILLGVMPPQDDKPGEPLYKAIEQTDAMLESWSARNKVTYQNLGPRLGPRVVGNIDTDGHPSIQGYQTIAQDLAKTITALEENRGR